MSSFIERKKKINKQMTGNLIYKIDAFAEEGPKSLTSSSWSLVVKVLVVVVVVIL